jgi:hypothetical protein
MKSRHAGRIGRPARQSMTPETLATLKGIITSMKAAKKDHDLKRYTALNVQLHDAW